MAASSVLAIIVLRLWRGDLSVPLSYSGDSNYQLMLVKGVIANGWWYTNHALGAPFGQELYDFAVGGDHLHLALIKLLTLFSSNAALVTNLYFLVSFPLSALTAALVMRWAGVSSPVAFIASVLYALTPYHFLRGENHAFLAADFAVPLAAYLVLGVSSGRPLFAKRTRQTPRWLRYLSGRSLVTVLSCVAVASTGTFYYGTFALILLLAATALGAAVRRSRRTLVTGAVVMGLIVASLTINLAPSLLYQVRHGSDIVVNYRPPRNSSRGGFTFGQLVLPINRHRVASLAALKRRYQFTASTSPGNESFDSSLGAVGTVGFIWLLWVALATCVGGGRRLGRYERYRDAAAATVVAFLVGTLGGASVLVTYLITSQFREWNRISIFIAFFSMLAVGLLLDDLRRVLGGGGARRLLFAALLATVLAVGVFDQTSNSYVPNYRALSRNWSTDATFVKAIERRLPPGAIVFQLPYIAFPEAGPPENYDLVKGYLHSERLRWTFGAMKGRPADWEQKLVEQPAPLVIPAIAAAGADGIWVDRHGYRDSGRGVDAQLRRVLRAAPLTSRDSRLLFFDLRPYAMRLRRVFTNDQLAALRTYTLTPPRIEAISGVWPGEDVSAHGRRSWRFSSQHGSVNLVNPTASAQRVTLTAKLVSGQRQPSTTFVRYPDGSSVRLRVSSAGTLIGHTMILRPGRNVLQIDTSAPLANHPQDPRPFYVLMVNGTFTEPVFRPFEVDTCGLGLVSGTRRRRLQAADGSVVSTLCGPLELSRPRGSGRRIHPRAVARRA